MLGVPVVVRRRFVGPLRGRPPRAPGSGGLLRWPPEDLEFPTLRLDNSILLLETDLAACFNHSMSVKKKYGQKKKKLASFLTF
jgi:hypothetical protein